MQIDRNHFHRLDAIPESYSLLDDFCWIRIYEWEKPTISLGFSQEIDVFNGEIERDDIEVVKRISGGRAVLHHREITYSVIAPLRGIFGETLHRSYENISTILLIFLNRLGVKADNHNTKIRGVGSKNTAFSCYDSLGFKEISVDGHKLIGSAQKRGRNVFLQHGSIPFYRHPYRLEHYLDDRFKSTSSTDPNDRCVFIDDFSKISMQDAKSILLDTFKEYFKEYSKEWLGDDSKQIYDALLSNQSRSDGRNVHQYHPSV